MHGIKRVKQTPEALEAKKQKERAKIQEFTALTDDLLNRKKTLDYSEQAFKLTSKLLQINPEFYTIWNYRRLIMLRGIFVDTPPEKVNSVLADDLVMTMSLLKSHPKVYWIWNHRRWCLENIPAGPGETNAWQKAAWDNELFVVEKLLDADARNFHAWDYRRYVLSSTPNPKPPIHELAYTSKKISTNFSNFSAWHQRSKVLPRLWETGVLEEEASREREFELVRNAMYTEPADQSVWVYHRWLVGSNPSKTLLLREIEAIRELLEEQPDSKWCIESTTHYSLLFLSLYPTDPAAPGLRDACKQALGELAVLDQCRRQRYVNLGREL